jgi:hypothetical protein
MLKIEIFGLISGAAEGSFAIGMLALIALAVIAVALIIRLRWQASKAPKVEQLENDNAAALSLTAQERGEAGA